MSKYLKKKIDSKKENYPIFGWFSIAIIKIELKFE